MNTICLICQHTAPDDRYLCDACAYRLHTWLRTLPQQATLLQSCLRPDAGLAQRGGNGRAHSPLPVDLRVLDLLGPGHVVPLEDPHGDQTGGVPITPLLAGWARYIASELPAVHRDAHGTVRIDRCADAWPRAGKGIGAWCTWLSGYLPYAVTRPWAAELYTQVEDLMGRVRRITHTTARRIPRDAPCPACDAFALVGRENELHISCEACGRQLTPDEYIAHRDQVMPALARTALLIAARQAAA
ncbi:hypothetical protein [Streptomyces sp. NPDC088270]|uniref:hypothetical protein n=1 Tax=unclassified Streptomyces TaxID=2593676 RepID=UPI00343AA1FC